MRRSKVGTGRTGRRRVGPRRTRLSHLPTRKKGRPSWACFWKHDQRKTNVNRSRTATCGYQPVFLWFTRGTTSALRSWLLTNVPSPFAILTCRIQNPNIPRAVRVSAAHGGAAGRGGAGQNRMPTGRVAEKPTVPLALHNIVDNCPERSFASTNKGNPM